MESYMQSFVALGMLGPLAGHFFTRLVTKEGFKLSGEDSVIVMIVWRKKRRSSFYPKRY